MYGNNRRPQQFSPVREGEELDVKIEAVGEKGDGIAKKNGFVIFVPGVHENDEVKIRVTRVLKKVGFGEVIGKPSGPIAQPQERKLQPTVKAPEPEETPEDSEDFGDESEDSEEEPEAEEESEDFDDEDFEDESDDMDEEESPRKK